MPSTTPGKPYSQITCAIEARTFDDGQECRAAVVDITKHKEAEEEIRRLNEKLGHRVARSTTQLETADEELDKIGQLIDELLRFSRLNLQL